MSLDPNIEADPTSGVEDGSQDQPTQPAAQSAGRTYTDADMAAARRSFQTDSQREWQRREAAIRSEFEQRFVPKEQPKAADQWDELLNADIAPKFRAALEAEFERRNAPIREQQEDLAFKNDEARLSAQYPDYTKNRAAILQFGAQAGISSAEIAYHAWRSQTQWQDPEKIGKQYLADYQKKKATQAAGTPLAEGRGGGAPSTKTNFRGKDGKLDKDAMDAAALEIMRSQE